jgi:hypothetical protein
MGCAMLVTSGTPAVVAVEATKPAPARGGNLPSDCLGFPGAKPQVGRPVGWAAEDCRGLGDCEGVDRRVIDAPPHRELFDNVWQVEARGSCRLLADFVSVL